MPNASSSINSGVALVTALIEGHHRFLVQNTGLTINASEQHKVLNIEGILSNNRHFINKTAMEYQPNGDATTEGQSLLILGYAYAFLATKNLKYLEAAEKYWAAYVKYFYAEQPVPETPQRWIANWIVNGKEPILANYPLNTTEPTEGGFQGISVAFTAGIGKIPAGTPTWGQYLDKATFAFVGVLGWNSIVASVYADNGSGGPNFSVPGTKYPVDWIIAWSGDKIDSNGNVIGSGFLEADWGTVKLQNTSLTGNYKLNYTTRQPTANGGYLIGRNEVQHNRPMHVPVQPTTVAFNKYRMSNAADGEEWFADACYVMWKITGGAKYKKAYDSVLFTLREFAGITNGFVPDPDYGKLFMPNQYYTDPFALNNSYDFQYPSSPVVTYAQGEGYFEIACSGGVEYSWESVIDAPVGVTTDTNFHLMYGAEPVSGTTSIYISARFGFKLTPSSPMTYWELFLEQLPYGSLYESYPYVTYFMAAYQADGKPYLMADMSRTDYYGGGVLSMYWSDDIYDGYYGRVVKCVFPDDDAGMDISFSDQTAGKAPINSIVYRSDALFDVRIVDDEGWRWYWIVPIASSWAQATFVPSAAILSGYQPGRAGRSNPTAPAITQVTDLTVILENSADTNKYFEYFCVNAPPPRFGDTPITGGKVYEFRWTLDTTAAWVARYSDIYFVNAVPQSATPLNYTPGVIPFSNVYDVTTGALDSSNGLPYPGYQYPMIWTTEAGDAAKLDKMLDFLLDSQTAYAALIGQLGPVASAYVWDIPANTQYGTANTFTMYHWGTDKAWSGYQPRAFQAGARALQEHAYLGKAIPAKLTTYLTNWVNWLWMYYNQYQQFPTDFPSTSVPVPVLNDFTGHMTGLWLAGLCLCELGGFTHVRLRTLQDAAVKELRANYRVPAASHSMNGSWSSDIHLSDDNSKFFGFWAGEILRGLGLYAMARNKNSKGIYHTFPLPARDEYASRVRISLQGSSPGRGGGVIDNSPYGSVTLREQGYSLDTSNKVGGYGSLYLTGSNSGILYPPSPRFHMPRKGTIEFWVNSTTRGGFVMSLGGGNMIAWSSFQFVWQEGQYINFAASSANAGYDIGSEGGSEGRIGVVPSGVWTHVQVCQDDDNWYGFIGGQLLWQRTYVGKDYFDPVTRGLLIGANYTDVWGTTSMTNCMQGRIQGLRMTPVCRNKTNFTPPIPPYPST